MVLECAGGLQVSALAEALWNQPWPPVAREVAARLAHRGHGGASCLCLGEVHRPEPRDLEASGVSPVVQDVEVRARGVEEMGERQDDPGDLRVLQSQILLDKGSAIENRSSDQ